MLKRSCAWLMGVAVVGLSACGGGGSGGGSPPPPPPPPPPPTNQAPTVADATAAVDPGTVLSGTLSGSDANGDTLTFAIGTGPTSGMIALSGPGDRDYEYTPDPAFVGADSFTFTASDGSLTSAEATVTINVNTKPVLTAASYSTNEDWVVDGTVAATDAEGDSLTFVVDSSPTRGSLTTFSALNGDFRYVPDAAEDGADSFTVSASDAFQTSDPVTIDVEIFRWAGTQQYGSSNRDSAGNRGIIRDTDGNIIVARTTRDTIDGSPNLGQSDAFIRKFDRRGNEVWTRQFGDADQNSGFGVVPIPGASDFFVLEFISVPLTNAESLKVRRFDSDGMELWAALVDFSGLDLASATLGTAAVADANGDLYVLSAAPRPTINKLSGVDGSPVWRRIFYERVVDGNQPLFPNLFTLRIGSIAINQDGNLITVGWFAEQRGGPRACNYCAWIGAFNPIDGTDVWVQDTVTPTNNCNEGTNAFPTSVVIAEDNGIVATGINVPGSPGFYEDGLIFKLNADATQEVWSYCDDSGPNIRSSFRPRPINARNGGVIAIGAWDRQDNVDFITIVKLDSGGQVDAILAFTEEDTLGNPADLFRAGGVVEDEQEYVYIHGDTDGQLPGVTALGDRDVFLLRLDPNFTLP